jgi:hypothetical protein
MDTAICVGGPYHGTRAPAGDTPGGDITVDGEHGPARYIMHHRITPMSALYAFEGSTEVEIAGAVHDLVKEIP